MMNPENKKSLTLEYVFYGLATIATIIGLTSVFKTDFISEAHDKALLWFAFALLAILIPYILEITFKDLGMVIDKINLASQSLDGAAITVKEFLLVPTLCVGTFFRRSASQILTYARASLHRAGQPDWYRWTRERPSSIPTQSVGTRELKIRQSHFRLNR